MIVQGAHAIRRGEPPDFTAGRQMRRDLFLIERSEPREALAEIVSLVSARLPRHYGSTRSTTSRCSLPCTGAISGSTRSTAALREALNPDGRPVRGGRLRIGDKLMMTGRNLHDLGLMNGTLLRLLDEIAAAATATMRRCCSAARTSSSACRPRRRSTAARLRLLGAPGPGDRAAGRGDRRASGRRRLLPAPGDALHRDHAREARDGDRRFPDVIARAARTPDTGSRHGRLEARLRELAGARRAS